MARTTKIATCCYCGTRAALTLQGTIRQEMACSSCGAPLHAMKSLRADAVDPIVHRAPRPGKRASASKRAALSPARWEDALARPKKRKRKSVARRLLSEAVDLLEDLFD
jgi:hypothetical protein